MIFFLFHIEIEGKGGWIIGGTKGYMYIAPPPLSNYWGGHGPPLPLPTTMGLAFLTNLKIIRHSTSYYYGFNTLMHEGLLTKMANKHVTLKTYFRIAENEMWLPKPLLISFNAAGIENILRGKRKDTLL